MGILSGIFGGLVCELSFIAEDISIFASKAVDTAKDHPVASMAIFTVATGGLCFTAAPLIATSLGSAGLLGAASTGIPISTLSGAPLTSASLAALGGGSLATGGAGMAGGTAVITGAGATAGTVTSSIGIVATKR